MEICESCYSDIQEFCAIAYGQAGDPDSGKIYYSNRRVSKLEHQKIFKFYCCICNVEMKDSYFIYYHKQQDEEFVNSMIKSFKRNKQINTILN